MTETRATSLHRTRTRLASALAVMATAMIAAACGNSSGGGGALTMVTYGGDAVRPMAAAYAAPFTHATGLKVVQDSPTDYSKLKAMEDAHNVSWNVINGDPYVTGANCGKLFARLKGVDRSAIDKRFITDDCSVPADTFSVVLMYNKSKFGNHPPRSWADFFDTKDYPGKRGMWNFVGGNALEIALLGDGVPAKQLYPLDTKRAYRKLSSIKPDLIFYSSLAQSSEMLLNGQASMVATLNTRAWVAARANPANVGVSWNQALISWEAWTVPAGASNLTDSMKLLDEVADPDRQVALARIYPVGPTVTHPDLSKVPAELRPWLPTSPEHLKTSILINERYYADHFDALNTSFTDFQSG